MSRRGKSRGSSAALAVTESAHNTLEEADILDPVIGVIRFGMDNIMKIANETIPYCSAEDEEFKQEVSEKMESSLLQLVEAELTYSQTATIVNEVVDELALQDNPNMDAYEFADSIDSINDLVNERIEVYKGTLTEEVLKAHPTYIQMKEQMETLMTRMDLNQRTAPPVENTDAQASAIDLEDSTMDDEEDQEIIPELDPISKLPLVDAVRNKFCRHVYGRAAMVQFLKKNPKTRCPAMGCDNPRFVKAAHMLEDPTLTAKIVARGGQTEPPAKVGKSAKAKAAPKGKRGRRRR